MNQILYTDNLNFKKAINRKKMLYKTQFFISILLFIVIIIVYFFYIHSRSLDDITTKKITNNYEISKLYNNAPSQKTTTYNQKGTDFTVIGMIEIPKINVYYPIISEATDELLKIAPCRIAGPMPNETGNLCIAGHNYDNYKFFSKLFSLAKDDLIIISTIDGYSVSYKIAKIYEVLASDLSPLDQTDEIKKQVTLITCNNFNLDNRIIIKAYSS